MKKSKTSLNDIIKTHNDTKNILDNKLIKILLLSNIKIDDLDLEYNLLYVSVKDNFMETINNFETINSLTQEFLKGLENIYNAFNQINSKLAIIYDVSKVSTIFPPTLLWKIGNFFSKKKKITNNILYCTCIITSSVALNNIFQTFINIYDNIKPIHLCSTKESAFNFINIEIQKYNTIMNDDLL